MKILELLNRLMAIQFQYGDMDIAMKSESVSIEDVEVCYKENEYGRVAILVGNDTGNTKKSGGNYNVTGNKS